MTNATEPMAVDYDAIMTQLLAGSLRHRNHLGNDHGLRPCVWARDFCTIGADAGRQTGKSAWIAKNIGKQDLLIVSNYTVLERFRAMMPGTDPDFFKYRVFTVRDIQMGKPHPDFLDCYVDSAVHVFHALPRKRLYEWAVSDTDEVNHTFLLLG